MLAREFVTTTGATRRFRLSNNVIERVSKVEGSKLIVFGDVQRTGDEMSSGPVGYFGALSVSSINQLHVSEVKDCCLQLLNALDQLTSKV